MNIEAFQRLRDHLAAQPDERWDMRLYCGTACCIAGHACEMNDKKPSSNAMSYWLASDILGLCESHDGLEASHVFAGHWTTKPIEKITRRDALRYLDRAIAERNPLVRIDS